MVGMDNVVVCLCFEGDDFKKGRQLSEEKSAPQRKYLLRLCIFMHE